MERIRLTKRLANRNRKADAAEPETAIDLGKNRTYHKIDEYHTFKPSVNHWEPDMRHEWKDNPREETGHGIPKMAKVYMAAKKATKLAMMLLGENATEASIESQARAFMRMGDKALTASIDRWAACQGEECKKDADEEAPKAPEAPAEKAPKAPEAPAEEAPKAPEAPAEACNVADEEAPKAPEAPAEEAPKAETVEEEVDVDELIPTDVDFDDDGAEEVTESDDAELKACFGADVEEKDTPAVEEGATVAKKAGVKYLAGQPTLTRVASEKNADDLTGLWDKWTSPDIR